MQSIEEVLQSLKSIVESYKSANDSRCYFAELYRQMTQRVSEGIKNGAFENGARMEKLDVLFASRYFEAIEAWDSQTCSQSWKVAFSETEKNQISVLQHLL